MARPTIGDFRGSEQNKPRPPPAAEAPTSVEAADSVEAAEPSSVVAGVADALTKDLDFLTPAERYRENLKRHKIELKDAEAIYDGVLTKGYYEEYVRIHKTQRAVFRTRMYEDHLRLQTVLEMQKPQLAISQDELITRYNLAASLYEWNGKALKHETDDDFDAVLKLVRRFPGPIFTLLSRELSKFDAKVMAVFDEGADANF
jgi:HrpA-like RNA helicase